MDELDLLWTDLQIEFDQVPEECFELRHLWLRLITDVALARLDMDQAGFSFPTLSPTIH